MTATATVFFDVDDDAFWESLRGEDDRPTTTLIDTGLRVPAVSTDDSVLAAALAYAAAGFYVGPLAAGTKHPGSVLGASWQRKTSRDPKVIASWFSGTNYGIFLHAGRSGVVVVDVDDPGRLHADLRRAVDELQPPFQSTRPDVPGRGHYVFRVPPGRRFGNALGTLTGGWGDIRGDNGVIVVAPTEHPSGGLYNWPRPGVVPVLPTYLADQLPDALDAAEAATDRQVSAFLAEHQTVTPVDGLPSADSLLDLQVRGIQRRFKAGESRHASMCGPTAQLMREARAGLVDAKLAADTLEAVFLRAVAEPASSARQGAPRTGAEARSEWDGLLAWGVAQGRASDPAATVAGLREWFSLDSLVAPAGGARGDEASVEDAAPTARPAAGHEPVARDGEVLEDEDEDERTRRVFPRLDWFALWADETEDEWVHHPLLPARRAVTIYSPPKVGKSLLAAELAVAVSRGQEFLGHLPTRRFRVLYVDFENDPRGDVRARLQAMGCGPADLDHLDYLSFPTMAGFDTDRGSVELLAAVRAYGSEVVVIDTVSRAVDGEENSNDTWLQLYRRTGLKLKQAGVAVIRLDHTGKDEAKGTRGGSAKSGDVDAVWRLTKITDSRLRLECLDTRFHLTTKVLHVTRETLPRLHHALEGAGAVTDHEAKVRHLVGLCDTNDIPADANRDEVRAFAKGRGLRVAQTVVQEVVRRRKAAPEVNGISSFTPLRGAGERNGLFTTGQGPLNDPI